MADFSPYSSLPAPAAVPPTTRPSVSPLPNAPAKGALKHASVGEGAPLGSPSAVVGVKRSPSATDASDSASAAMQAPVETATIMGHGGQADAANAVSATHTQSAAKRVRIVGFQGDLFSRAATAPAADEGGAAAAAKLQAVLTKLEAVVSDDRKYARGVDVLCRAIEASLGPSTSSLFVPVIRQALAPFSRIGEPMANQWKRPGGVVCMLLCVCVCVCVRVRVRAYVCVYMP